jgi:hypothetical protein
MGLGVEAANLAGAVQPVAANNITGQLRAG